jgi:hypothetical protein
MDKLIYSILINKRNNSKQNGLPVGLKGISGSELYVVTIDEISAVVSDINRSGLIADRSSAIEYAGVIEALSHKFTLLPMRFGSIMKSTDAIEKMVVVNYPEIYQNLQKVDNKYEFGIKVLCDSEKLRASLIGQSASGNISQPGEVSEISKSVYRDWVEKKLQEHRLEELMLTHVDSVIAEITLFLNRLNAVTHIKKMVTETTIVDGVCLLEKGHKDPLINVIETLQSHYPGLSFVLTGPWPPYSFVDITIK